MCSPKHKTWIQVTAKFDTQTPENWISTLVVARLGAEPEQGPVIRYVTFNGEELESPRIVKNVKWGAVGADSRSRVTDFRLAPKNAPFEVLFGSDFIDSEEIYTFNEANLILVKQKETKGQSPVIQQAIRY